MPLSPDDFIAELWTIARQVPMIEHPWFKGIIEHRWTREQIVLGEVQHYLRVRTNPIFFGYIAVNAVSEKQYGLMEVVLAAALCSGRTRVVEFCGGPAWWGFWRSGAGLPLAYWSLWLLAAGGRDVSDSCRAG